MRSSYPPLRDAGRPARVGSDGWRLGPDALPHGWRVASGLNDIAGIQAIAPLRRRYLIVISEHRADFELGFTLEQHAEMTLAALEESVRIVWRNGRSVESSEATRACSWRSRVTASMPR